MASGDRRRAALAFHSPLCASGGMADASASGAGVRKGVGVQVPPRARRLGRNPLPCRGFLRVWVRTDGSAIRWIVSRTRRVGPGAAAGGDDRGYRRPRRATRVRRRSTGWLDPSSSLSTSASDVGVVSPVSYRSCRFGGLGVDGPFCCRRHAFGSSRLVRSPVARSPPASFQVVRPSSFRSGCRRRRSTSSDRGQVHRLGRRRSSPPVREPAARMAPGAPGTRPPDRR